MTVFLELRVILNVFENDSLIYQLEEVFKEILDHVCCKKLSFEGQFQYVLLYIQVAVRLYPCIDDK